MKLPHITHHSIEALGIPFIEFMWSQFCERGVNKYGLIYYEHVPAISAALSAAVGNALDVVVPSFLPSRAISNAALLRQAWLYPSRLRNWRRTTLYLSTSLLIR